ncbi:T9SS type A sorting domain-containing protein [Hymenobacter wooponensis]|uniref:T9SS type A sorting domain-containing protein n=1 Tax=Hymenobacter wooponensis TaxID=1525360 RepID=A0A4Z0MGV7_9BACT|nr:T9SS type A sorting domain-containing protein [Hymenobacter wooponensis]TGD78590.1 T9SS type A sorting domain-containing protein [Hymenobacter wooponensis]
MKFFTFLGSLLAMLLCISTAQAQTKTAKPAPAKPTTVAAKPAVKPATTPKPAVAPAVPATAVASAEVATASAPPALITDKMETAAPNTDALKVRAETNPLTKRLTVRTNASGPTRVELNGTDGRPVITRDIMSGSDAVVLDVSNLPAGTYIVHCSSGERRGIKRVSLGQ